ncbi:MAG TPA: beta-propeller fold lactonase family protein [Candidatus Angelobacter sp.]|nr:beta-propeller fold lactonase family protein [Candidatus Angelobacter sp.]
MKNVQVFSIVFVSIGLLILAGCGGVSASSTTQPSPTPVSSSPSPTPTPTPSASASHFIYGISVFETETGYEGGSINSSTGQITPLPTLSFTDAGLGQNIVPQLVSDPQNRFLYALNIGAGHGFVLNPPGIVELQINQQTGTLTPVPGSPLIFTELGRQGQLAIDHTGHFLYQPNAGTFDVYTINQSTGLLTNTGSTASSLGDFTTISPDGRFLFNADDTSVEGFSIDVSGNLTLVQPPIPAGSGSRLGQLTVSPDNQFLYILNMENISIFKIGATGTLTPAVGSPFTIDHGGNSLSLTPDSKHLYIAFLNGITFSVKGYTYNSTASTLTPIPDAVITGSASSVNVDGSGKFAYVTESRMLSTYSIDPVTGGLTKVSQTTQPRSESSLSMIVVQ